MARFPSYVYSLHLCSTVIQTPALLAILPTSFDTPMFWEESELEELKGTAVVGGSDMLMSS